ncbi:hypothetical protein EN962_08555 [Mesorhizobium sp. M7A.F.Ca.CA.001.09.2.1]|uniref:DUF6894 domain-containing protein n=3 Tax=Mesorhizobium TaxID=68287 RepID=A0AB38TK32_9HYPH|nr:MULTISPECIES: hypothetical protein [Mesorhizobium]RUZ53419.1 hypothetical protein EN947_38795 [Mesorhizobium sp. M7A.F.Ca.US.003.02.2.1]MDF3218185.1 hypothetical protein [Mesorhizobium ciceri]MDF3233705.1 hypothetical protein [Mesorhizobium sp. DSM 30133]RUU15593.1 hypothetical protein EOC84_31790 [Mesorhizobium sp. Primo-B]RUU33683.1 hypothetical protein EOC83_31705 [Mesorhizobium sp. Primo-A]
MSKKQVFCSDERTALSTGAKMPLFFFDIRDGKSHSPDTEGTHYVGALEARVDAVKMLVAMAQDEVQGGLQSNLSVTVSDESRRPVMEANIDCSIKVF